MESTGEVCTEYTTRCVLSVVVRVTITSLLVRWNAQGTHLIMKKTKKYSNLTKPDGPVMQIPLTKGAYALIDTEDFDRVAQHGWVLDDTFKASGYVRAHALINKKATRLHRFILGVTDPSIIIDHIDCDPLNNTKANLRVVTKSENCLNRKNKAKGYSYDRRRGKWQAYVTRAGKTVYIGRFNTEYEAASAVEIARKEWYVREE